MATATAGCGDEAADVAAQTARRAQALSVQPPSPRQSGSVNGKKTHPALVFDASLSMQGYVGCKPGQRTDFQQTADAIAARLGIQEVFLFGAERHGSAMLTRVPPARATGCSELFTRENNPDAELVRIIQRDTNRSPVVYMTDGVQSAADAASPSPAILALGEWVSSGHGLGIIALRGRFDGKFWSEESGALLGEVNLTDRPYYAVIFAESDSVVENILDRLDGLPGAVRTFRLSAVPTDCSAINRATGRESAGSNPPWEVLGTSATAELLTAGGVVATIQCQLPKHFALRSFGLEVHPIYRSWSGRDFASASQPHGQFHSAPATRSDSIVVIPLMAQVARDPSSLFGLFELEIVPTPGSFVDVVDSLSTEHDISASSATRTYRFSWLLDGVIRARFAASAGRVPYTVAIHYPEK